MTRGRPARVGRRCAPRRRPRNLAGLGGGTQPYPCTRPSPAGARPSPRPPDGHPGPRTTRTTARLAPRPPRRRRRQQLVLSSPHLSSLPSLAASPPPPSTPGMQSSFAYSLLPSSSRRSSTATTSAASSRRSSTSGSAGSSGGRRRSFSHLAVVCGFALATVFFAYDAWTASAGAGELAAAPEAGSEDFARLYRTFKPDRTPPPSSSSSSSQAPGVVPVPTYGDACLEDWLGRGEPCDELGEAEAIELDAVISWVNGCVPAAPSAVGPFCARRADASTGFLAPARSDPLWHEQVRFPSPSSPLRSVRPAGRSLIPSLRPSQYAYYSSVSRIPKGWGLAPIRHYREVRPLARVRQPCETPCADPPPLAPPPVPTRARAEGRAPARAARPARQPRQPPAHRPCRPRRLGLRARPLVNGCRRGRAHRPGAGVARDGRPRRRERARRPGRRPPPRGAVPGPDARPGRRRRRPGLPRARAADVQQVRPEACLKQARHEC